MKVADLVKHSEISSLGVGLVTKDLGVHCMVQWTRDALRSAGYPSVDAGPILEANSMLEIINASR